MHAYFMHACTQTYILPLASSPSLSPARSLSLLLAPSRSLLLPLAPSRSLLLSCALAITPSRPLSPPLIYSPSSLLGHTLPQDGVLTKEQEAKLLDIGFVFNGMQALAVRSKHSKPSHTRSR